MMTESLISKPTKTKVFCESDLTCTACHRDIDVKKTGSVHGHPVLNVLICRKCFKWYTSGDIEKGEDGVDLQCRWCGDGGDLFCCNTCTNVFCKDCVKTNLGLSELRRVELSDKWMCYSCDNTPLTSLTNKYMEIVNARQKNYDIVVKDDVERSNDEEEEVAVPLSNLNVPSLFEWSSLKLNLQDDSSVEDKMKYLEDSLTTLLPISRTLSNSLSYALLQLKKVDPTSQAKCTSKLIEISNKVNSNLSTLLQNFQVVNKVETTYANNKTRNNNNNNSDKSHKKQKSALAMKQERPEKTLDVKSATAAAAMIRSNDSTSPRIKLTISKKSITSASNELIGDSYGCSLYDKEEEPMNEGEESKNVNIHNHGSRNSKQHIEDNTKNVVKDNNNSNDHDNNTVNDDDDEYDDDDGSDNDNRVNTVCNVNNMDNIKCNDDDIAGDDVDDDDNNEEEDDDEEEEDENEDDKVINGGSECSSGDEYNPKLDMKEEKMRRRKERRQVMKNNRNKSAKRSLQKIKEKLRLKKIKMQMEKNSQGKKSCDDDDDDDDDKGDGADDDAAANDDNDGDDDKKGVDQSKKVKNKSKIKTKGGNKKEDKVKKNDSDEDEEEADEEDKKVKVGEDDDCSDVSKRRRNILDKKLQRFQKSRKAGDQDGGGNDDDDGDDGNEDEGKKEKMDKTKKDAAGDEKLGRGCRVRKKKSMKEEEEEDEEEEADKGMSKSIRSVKKLLKYDNAQDYVANKKTSSKAHHAATGENDSKAKQEKKNGGGGADGWNDDVGDKFDEHDKDGMNDENSLTIDATSKEKMMVKKKRMEMSTEAESVKSRVIDRLFDDSFEAESTNMDPNYGGNNNDDDDDDVDFEDISGADNDEEMLSEDNVDEDEEDDADEENNDDNYNDDDDDDILNMASKKCKEKQSKKSKKHRQKIGDDDDDDDGDHGDDVRVPANGLDDDSNSRSNVKNSKKRKRDRLLAASLLSSGEEDAETTTKKSDKNGESMPKKKRGRRRKRKDDDDDEEDDEGLKAILKESDGEVEEKKKKRRRIMNDSSGENEDGNSSSDDNQASGKKRKKIHKIITSKKLSKETIDAAKAEEERRKRIDERQKLFNQVVVEDTSSPTKCPMTTKLVLEADPETNEPLIEVHKKVICKLKPHQVEAVKFMWNCCVESLEMLKKEEGSGCILAHCMGLGKTLSVISFVHTLLRHKKLTRMTTCLVLTPLNTILNWESEFERWLKGAQPLDVYEMSTVKDNWSRSEVIKTWRTEGGVLIMGYDMFRTLSQLTRVKNKKQKQIILEGLLDPGPDLVVCDEGHILKNDATGLSKACVKIRTKRRVVLTGTPLQNNLNEYHCMVNFVKPNLLGTRKEFLNRFVNPITNGQCSDSTPRDVKIMKNRAHVLHETLAGCVQRRDYSALTKYLLPKYEYVLSIRLSSVQTKLYETYLKRMSSGEMMGPIGRGSRIFTDYQNLMKIWTHPWVLKLDEIRQECKRNYKDDADSFIDDSNEESFPETGESESEAGSASEDDWRPRRKTRASANNEESKEKKEKKCKSSKKEGKDEEVDEDDDDDNNEHLGEIVKGWKSRSRRGEAPTPDEIKKEVEEKMKESTENKISDEWWADFLKHEDEFDISISGKLILLAEILKLCESIGDKVLLFSQSLLSLDLIERFLLHWDKHVAEDPSKQIAGTQGWDKGIDYIRMDGSTSAQNRQDWTNMFNDESNQQVRLFLISTKAGSLGINLVAANRVIIFDASWNPTHDVQSIFRVYRFGQTKPVYVYRFLAQGTMEEKIYERQVMKQSLAQRVIDEHQIERHFTSADLNELYNFKPDVYNPNNENPTPKLPQDRLLAELMTDCKEWIVQYHEHDSLLENRPEEELTEEERKAAWEEFEQEKKGVFTNRHNPLYSSILGQTNMYGDMYASSGKYVPDVQKFIQAMYMQYPNLSQDELTEKANLYMQYQMAQQQQHQRALMQQQMERERLLRMQQESMKQRLAALQQMGPITIDDNDNPSSSN